MFKPQYTITNKLLANIKRINELVIDLNNRHFPDVILMDFEKKARILSTYASTSIEGNPLPLTEVKKVLKSKSEHIRDTEKEVLNYNQALESLNDNLQKGKVKQLRPDLILNIHKQVVKGLLPEHQVGHWRKEPVQILDPHSQQAVFLPPDWQLVPNLIKELLIFVNQNKDKIDSLIIAGVFHKQFVLIHPFMDGNGRTTRLLTKLLLADMGLNTFNLFSFENYYNQNVTKYFQKVGEFGDYNELLKQDKVDFTQWLEYFTDGLIDELLRVKKILPLSAQSPEQQLKDHHQAILKYLQTHPFITDSDYAKLVDRAKATRALDFNFLIEQGLIKRKGQGKNTHYVLN
ncbi:MAG: hypothetical protein GF390_03650 [Candidatus Pacebacteria bacterium]|nr:hypothetical protein [Candidatus Paceibacterota bacterium]